MSDGERVFGNVLGFVLLGLAWWKLVGLFKVWVFPWLYRFTALSGAVLDALYPGLHRMLYLAPYYRRELPVPDDWAWLIRPFAPVAVFVLAWATLALYSLLLRQAAEELCREDPDPLAAFGWMAAAVLLFCLHAAVAAATPPLTVL